MLFGGKKLFGKLTVILLEILLEVEFFILNSEFLNWNPNMYFDF